MLHVLLMSAMFGLPGHTDCMCYMYENRTHTMQVYVSKHLFASLIRDKFCVKVYTKREGKTTIHVCTM